jgi:hypothetical protein
MNRDSANTTNNSNNNHNNNNHNHVDRKMLICLNFAPLHYTYMVSI